MQEVQDHFQIFLFFFCFQLIVLKKKKTFPSWSIFSFLFSQFSQNTFSSLCNLSINLYLSAAEFVYLILINELKVIFRTWDLAFILIFIKIFILLLFSQKWWKLFNFKLIQKKLNKKWNPQLQWEIPSHFFTLELYNSY